MAHEELADGLLAVIEGSYVLAKAKGAPEILARQLGLYRDHLARLFG